MNRRLALTLSALFALGMVAALALTSRAAAHHTAAAPDPLLSPLRHTFVPPAPPPPCLSGPGAAASTLSAHVDLPSLPDLSRRAFTTERLAERAGAAPAFPQRMGLAASPCPSKP
jgi:hypothetical protein